MVKSVLCNGAIKEINVINEHHWFGIYFGGIKQDDQNKYSHGHRLEKQGRTST